MLSFTYYLGIQSYLCRHRVYSMGLVTWILYGTQSVLTRCSGTQRYVRYWGYVDSRTTGIAELLSFPQPPDLCTYQDCVFVITSRLNVL